MEIQEGGFLVWEAIDKSCFHSTNCFVLTEYGLNGCLRYGVCPEPSAILLSSVKNHVVRIRKGMTGFFVRIWLNIYM